MMRKTWLPLAILILCFTCSASLISGCASSPEVPPTRSITRLWEPAFQPDYAFEPCQPVSKPTGPAVGIVALDFSYETVPPGERMLTPAERQHRDAFVDAFFDGLKKMLASQGMEVKGPYAAYDDMTFAERSKCNFVLRPKVLFEFEPKRETLIEELTGFGGPYGEPRVYGRSEDRLDVRARLELEIIDPRTRKQLDWHLLKVDEISESYDQLWSQWTMNYDRSYRIGWRPLEYSRKKYPNYHNGDNATGRALEEAYHNFMPRLSDMITAKELKRLESRKREARKRR
jgi:hypothetical protein